MALLSGGGRRLRIIADKLVAKAEEGDLQATQEIADRLDGSARSLSALSACRRSDCAPNGTNERNPEVLPLRRILNVSELADGNTDRHAQKIARLAKPRAYQGYRLAGMAGIGDRDQIKASANAVGGILVEPARARKKHLKPCMRGSGTGHPDLTAVQCRIVQIAAHET